MGDSDRHMPKARRYGKRTPAGARVNAGQPPAYQAVPRRPPYREPAARDNAHSRRSAARPARRALTPWDRAGRLAVNGTRIPGFEYAPRQYRRPSTSPKLAKAIRAQTTEEPRAKIFASSSPSPKPSWRVSPTIAEDRDESARHAKCGRGRGVGGGASSCSRSRRSSLKGLAAPCACHIPPLGFVELTVRRPQANAPTLDVKAGRFRV